MSEKGYDFTKFDPEELTTAESWISREIVGKLGKRHLRLAHTAEFTRTMPLDILEKSIARVWTSSAYADISREHLDFEAAISGDDLARINAFEPKDPNLKPIGAQSGLWSDVRHHAGKWTA